MKFTKKQKEIVKKIASGEIYDVYKYLITYNLISFVQYTTEDIEKAFYNDNFPKEYYLPTNMKPKYYTVETPDTFKQKVKKGTINPDNYRKSSISLNYQSGIKKLKWNNKVYMINFYKGINIASSFDEIISFLALWNYLKSEMLILELPSELKPETLALFYNKVNVPVYEQNLSQEEKIKEINFEACTYDDESYINDKYEFSYKNCQICKDYLDKKIYPTPELNIFIQKNFKTNEERTQNKALVVAVLAIIVSIIISIIPYFQKDNSDDVSEIITKINDLEKEIKDINEQNKKYNKKSIDNSNEIKEKLDSIDKILNSLDMKQNNYFEGK